MRESFPGEARSGFSQMPKKRYDVDQIIPLLCRADVELGKRRKVPEVCRMLGIVQQTYYRWRQKYGSMAAEVGVRVSCGHDDNLRLWRQ